MKRTILLILTGIVIGGGAVWIAKHNAPNAPEEKSPEADHSKNGINHDTDGNAMVSMSPERQQKAGIATANPEPARIAPELKGFGRVMDPTPLAALMTELATVQAAFAVSSNELARLKTLEAQGNASPRAVQSAESTAQRDLLAVQSAKDRLAMGWGIAMAVRDDLPGLIGSLTSLRSVLVRIDVPLSEKMEEPPAGARVVDLSGRSADAEFLAAAPVVDPQNQSRGFICFIPTNTLHLLAAEAVTGFLKMPGDPMAGVIVPADAVVRMNGKGWVYSANSNSESFTRKEIALDHRAQSGWFVTNGVSADSRLVVIGAQILLSEELKSSMSAD